jgi:Flp pilus assembly protein TadD
MQKRLTEQGLKYLEAGQFEKAAQILTLLVKSFPDNADAQHMLGIIELERGNFDQAMQLVKRAVQLAPNNSVFYNTLGNIEVHRKHYPQAENAFLNAIKFDSEKIEYKYNLAHYYLSQNQFQKAIDFYYYILHSNPTHYLSIRGITVCYLFSNEPEIALEHASEWVTEFSIYDEPYYYLGLCYYALNNIAAALEAYDRGISLNPNNYDILTAIGACYRALGNFSIAESYLLKSINLEPNNPTALYNLGCVHFDHGDFETAKKLFLNTIGLDPFYAEPICGLGKLELVNGNADKALEYFDQAQQAEPLNSKPIFLTATTWLQLQHFTVGWPAYRATFETPLILQDIPNWQGQKLSDEHTLLIWVPKENYDIGQQLMFASLLPELHGFVKNIIVLCDTKLVNLLQHSFPSLEFIDELDQYNMPERFAGITDQVPLNALGQFFRTSSTAFQNKQSAGYLKCNIKTSKILREKYQQLFPNKKLVGVSCRATTQNQAIDHIKSSNLNDWLPILNTSKCQFINLQPQFANNSDAPIYVDPEISANDIAEQIASLDLIISVDNDIASLAGALGITTYTLVPYCAEWYWFNETQQSLWYPSMRIFRQQKPNKWSGPIKAIAKLL